MVWWQVTGLCFLTGIALFSVGAVFHVLVPVLVPALAAEYEKTAVFRPWEGWTRTYMLIHPFAFGTVFTLVYLLLQRAQGTNGLFCHALGGIRFGAIIFLVGSLPIFLLNLASLNVSGKVIAAWATQRHSVPDCGFNPGLALPAAGERLAVCLSDLENHHAPFRTCCRRDNLRRLL